MKGQVPVRLVAVAGLIWYALIYAKFCKRWSAHGLDRSFKFKGAFISISLRYVIQMNRKFHLTHQGCTGQPRRCGKLNGVYLVCCIYDIDTGTAKPQHLLLI